MVYVDYIQFAGRATISISWVYRSSDEKCIWLLIYCFKLFYLFSKLNADANQFETMILSILLPWIFFVSLLIFEPGERVTNQFNQFGIKLDRCKWNKLSIRMQKMYLIFLSDTQQPEYIRTYGGIRCTRQTFEKVFKKLEILFASREYFNHISHLPFQITTKGFSYFMTLRRFGE